MRAGIKSECRGIVKSMNSGSTNAAPGVPETPKQRRGISGSTLKLIAIVSMLIDHIAAVVLVRVLLDRGGGVISGSLMETNRTLVMVYQVMRAVGRLGFPVFAFLLVEGFTRTHNKWNYAMRLGVFALISEIPFDLAFNSRVLEFGYQNVFFTLFLGLIAMIAVDAISRKTWIRGNGRANHVAAFLLEVLSVAAIAALAELIHTDYGAIGVCCIMVLYIFRRNKAAQVVAGCIAFLWEIPAPLAFLPIWFYNGERGLKLKYVFYLFYPVHLLVLYLICVCMGISGYPAI